jgi:hypothetical protein
MSEEEIQKCLDLHGYVPWTLVIADSIESGAGWDDASIVKHLRMAQEKIDQLTRDKVALVQEVLEMKVKK